MLGNRMLQNFSRSSLFKPQITILNRVYYPTITATSYYNRNYQLRRSHNVQKNLLYHRRDFPSLRQFSINNSLNVRITSILSVPEKDRKISEKSDNIEPPKKEGLVARFKKMYKEYWYVLVPVHVVTSACWFGGFFYLSKSGVDIATTLESLRFNETIIAHLRNSKLGHFAIAYFLYKIFTPLRYMVTLGGTTVSIKYLSRLGYIRPVLTKDQFMKMYQDKKAAKIQSIKDKVESQSGKQKLG